MSALVVIPTYNEAENVRDLLCAVRNTQCDPTVLIVDDNSPDGTADIVAALARSDQRIGLLVRPAKEGLGPAYLAGFAKALDDYRPDAIVQMDADGSHDPADIDRLVDCLRGADLAIGSRYVDGGAVIGWPRQRWVLSRGGNFYARRWLRVPIRDLTGGFKAWRSTLLRDILIGQVQMNGYGFQVETTYRALRAGARVVEVPITFRDRTRGASKMTPNIAWEGLRRVPSIRRRIR